MLVDASFDDKARSMGAKQHTGQIPLLMQLLAMLMQALMTKARSMGAKQRTGQVLSC